MKRILSAFIPLLTFVLLVLSPNSESKAQVTIDKDPNIQIEFLLGNSSTQLDQGNIGKRVKLTFEGELSLYQATKSGKKEKLIKKIELSKERHDSLVTLIEPISNYPKLLPASGKFKMPARMVYLGFRANPNSESSSSIAVVSKDFNPEEYPDNFAKLLEELNSFVESLN